MNYLPRKVGGKPPKNKGDRWHQSSFLPPPPVLTPPPPPWTHAVPRNNAKLHNDQWIHLQPLILLVLQIFVIFVNKGHKVPVIALFCQPA